MIGVTVFRGTHHIGGTCIEIRSGEQRLILDLGFPLMERDGGELDEEATKNPTIENGILPDVEGLYHFQEPSVNAVILSHHHLDHFGLMGFVNPAIPIYLGKATQCIIELGSVFWPQKIVLQNIRNFDHWKPFQIRAFRITSHLIDHSAFDAACIVIEVGGKKVFYSGDLRGHGRKSKLFDKLIQNPVQDVDCLLMEGTTIGSSKRSCNSEQQAEEQLYQTFSNQKDATFMIAAGSNIDRIVSIFKASNRAGKQFVIDPYTAYVLDQLKQFSPGLPQHDWDGIRVLFVQRHSQIIVENFGKQKLFKYRPSKITYDEIVQNRRDLVLKLPMSYFKRVANLMIENRPLNEAKMIFSLWPGYLKTNESFYEFCKEYSIELLKIHASGHAPLEDLKRLAVALNPKVLIPIHTLAGNDYEKHFDNVIRIDDLNEYLL